MMAYRWEPRSTTPGDYRWKTAALEAAWYGAVVDPGDAAGPLTKSLYGLRTLLLESPSFLGFVGAADTTEGALKIHLFDTEDDDPREIQRARPFAVLWPADENDLEVVSGGAQNFLMPGGQIVMVLTDRESYPGDRSSSGFEFCRQLDLILADVIGQAAEDDHLPITSIRFLLGPTRSPVKDDPATGGYWHCALLVTWGGRGG